VIVDAVLSLVGFLVSIVAAALPASSSWMGDSRPDFDSWGASVGERVGPIDQIVPIAVVFDLLDATFSYVMPAVMLYVIAHWIYSHLPFVGTG